MNKSAAGNVFAPIAVFAFNRPDHLAKTLGTLASNTGAEKSDVVIFCDGPRTANEKEKTETVREIAALAGGFQSVTVVPRDINLGCASSVITGLNAMFAEHDRVIVIEDDIVTSPYTLSFFNRCLKIYEHENTVFNISGWSPPHSLMSFPAGYQYDAYFLPRFNCWGWASWRNRWQKVDWSMSDYSEFESDKYLQDAFNQGGADLSPMLRDQMEGRINSWAIRMDYARFKHGCVGLGPVHSYTTNIGMGSGTHTLDATDRFDNDLSLANPLPRLPGHVFLDRAIVRSFQKIFITPSLPVRAINKASRLLLGKNLLR